MKLRNILIAILFFFSSAGCQSVSLEDGNGADQFFEEARTLSFETIEQETFGNYDIETQNLVIRNEEAFNNFWEQLHGDRQPVPPVPEVDFAQNMVVITVMGTRPSGGYMTEITEAGARGERLGIRVKQKTPGEGCVVTASLTNPYHIIKMERSELDAEFFVEEISVDCTE